MNVVLAWLSGIVFGASLGGLFAYALGLQAGKKLIAGQYSIHLTRDDVVSLVGHRMQDILRIVRSRMSSGDGQRDNWGDASAVCATEFSKEYHHLARIFVALRRPEVDSAVRMLQSKQSHCEEDLTT